MKDRHLPGDFIVIHRWMIDPKPYGLGLRGAQLHIYALVFGFSKDGASYYLGGNNYAAMWAGCSSRTASESFKALVKEGLIVEHGKHIQGSKKGKRYAAVKDVLKFLGRQKDSRSHEISSPENSSPEVLSPELISGAHLKSQALSPEITSPDNIEKDTKVINSNSSIASIQNKDSRPTLCPANEFGKYDAGVVSFLSD